MVSILDWCWPSSPSPLRMLTLGVWDLNDLGDSLKVVSS